MNEKLLQAILAAMASQLTLNGFPSAGQVISTLSLRLPTAADTVAMIAGEVDRARTLTEEAVDALTTKMTMLYPGGGDGPVYAADLAALTAATDRRDEYATILMQLSALRSLCASIQTLGSLVSGTELVAAAQQVEEGSTRLARLLEVDAV